MFYEVKKPILAMYGRVRLTKPAVYSLLCVGIAIQALKEHSRLRKILWKSGFTVAVVGGPHSALQ